ncbi:MAG: MBL fold metallo-hydrolase [Fuerstiella sp.]|nr:MBL fold metallo-hydrolase [Fuerstiella sp.]
MLQKITDSLAWIKDTCSVYVITQGDAALLIDCGTHVSPGLLQDAGIPPVERVLLTHFHRDQCAAAAAWQDQGAEIVVPFTERRFYEESDLLKASYDTWHNYDCYYPNFGMLNDVVTEQYAFDYESVRWRDLEFEVVPLPGHTFGSVGYLFTCDNQRVLACGDLMSAPGKLHEYFSSQWKYMDFKGHTHHLESLKTAVSLQPDLILPGHNTPFESTEDAFTSLQQPLEELYELFYARPYEWFQPQFRHISDHVVEVSNAGAFTYIVHDDDGHAVFIDCGYVSTDSISANPSRFIDHLTPALEPELGIRAVEWFLPTHYHDDHLAGYPALRNRYGTRVVSSPEVKDILEHPERYDMPCLDPRGLKVNHVVQRGNAFHWRGTDFFIEQHPGQTLYHQLIRFDVDDMRFLVVGDNISGMCFQEQRDHIHSFIPKNRTPVTSYTDMPRQILEANPDILLTGHGGGVPHDQHQTERWQVWMKRWQDLFTQIIDQPHPNLGMDPGWVEFYPYKVRIRPGDTVAFNVRITNHEPETKTCELKFRSVEGVELTPTATVVDVAGGSTASCQVTAEFPQVFTTHSLPVLADVTWQGNALGELAEAIAWW